MRGNALKLKEAGLRLHARKKFFSVVKDWTRLPRDAVAVPSLEMFKDRMNETLSNLTL